MDGCTTFYRCGPTICLVLHFPFLAPATVGGALARGVGGNPFTIALAKERKKERERERQRERERE